MTQQQQNKTIDEYGVQKIYPDAKGKTQVYMGIDPDKSKFNVSYGGGSHISYEKKTQGKLTYFTTKGSPINYHSGNKSGRSTRIDTYPDGGMWKNKTKFSWKDNPGYLYTDKGIKNGEFTTFIRVHDDLGTHQAYAHKVGGRDEDALRSLVEMVYPTSSHGDVTINYNYAHFPYVKAKPKILKKVPAIEEDKWVGVKTIHIVGKDSTHWEMWADLDPIAKDGSINNNWEKIAEYEDKGCDGYDGQRMEWACHKDVCRVDGFGSVDFALFSDREIDPNSKPGIQTNPAKPISEQGDKPERDDSQDDNSVEDVQAAEQWIKDNPKDALKVLEGLPQLQSSDIKKN
jgi:hypothetical protein